jgi:NADH-quinone oxidoreductase subunit F
MADLFQSVSELEACREKLIAAKDKDKTILSVCTSGCTAYGANKVGAELSKEAKAKGLTDNIEVRLTGCQGFCQQGPLVIAHPQKTFYQQVKTEDAAEIIDSISKGEVVERLLHKDADQQVVENEDEIPFYKKQKRVLLKDNSFLDPTNIDTYIEIGGYRALGTVLSKMQPEEVVKTMTASGLRGRGGGGFPAGVKWESCRKAPSQDGIRYIICNADEGDPGAFMDRALMEGNPHSVIEGMIIGAFAIGKPGKPIGYVYIRNEYPLAVERLGIALEQARQRGLLGKNILGSGFDFDITINKGGGAFVCGESTALMASIEGFVGEPRAKHIHTVEAGLYDKPTNLHNVETWDNVPLIINEGVDWYTSLGTGDVSENPWGGSKGTKIFALVGKVKNTGLVEVPMGASLREIIYDIGGGIIDNKKFKAVQTGGPSGGCLPESLLDLEVDFDKLDEAGSMMGSGGMIVMDENTCMVDVAKYFLHFLVDESCGKCVTCREGLKQLCVIVDRICDGKGKEGDLELLEELSQTVAEASLCALGTSAPNPLRSTIKYFKEEYEEHINNKKCRAKVCKSLIKFSVIDENCTGCLLCKKKCPTEAVSGEKKQVHKIDQSICIQCGVCADVCKFDAIAVE